MKQKEFPRITISGIFFESANKNMQEISRTQSPLLAIAAPFALGIIFAGALPPANILGSIFFALALFFLGVFICLRLFEKIKAAKCIFIIFSFFAGAFHFLNFSYTPYSEWATREAALGLQIQSADSNAKGASYGFAKIVEAPDYLKKAEGAKVWYYAQNTKNLFRGDKIKGAFIVRKVPNASEGFDSYLSAKKIFFKVDSQSACHVEEGKFPYSFYRLSRKYISDNLALFYFNGRENTEGALAYKAMILGDKTALSKDAKASFTATGTMHIFAISGLHVAMIAAVIYALAALVRIPRNISPLICLPILFLYVNACGAPPSAMRAFMMIALVWVSLVFLRKPKPLAGFIAAFFMAILINPTDIFDIGFGLSYSVVLAILLYAVPVFEILKTKINPKNAVNSYATKLRVKITDYLLVAMLISMAALCVSAPLTACYFSYIAPLSLLYSIPYVFAAGIVVSLGVFANFLPDIIAQFTNEISAFTTHLMIGGAELGKQSFLVINLKISPTAAFVLEFCLIFLLFTWTKIPTCAKYFALPVFSILGITIAALI